MNVQINPHAEARMKERGIKVGEILETIENGERFAAKYEREGFRMSFPFEGSWQGRQYAMKQVEVYAVREGDAYVVITALAKYY